MTSALDILKQKLPPEAFDALMREKVKGIKKAKPQAPVVLPPLHERRELFKWQVAPSQDQSLLLLFTGGAGGGKSDLAAHMVDDYARRYPGMFGLLLRKTREDAKRSIVSVLGRINKNVAVPEWGNHQFRYPNGSLLAWGGMKDDRQKEAIRSIGPNGAVDFIWMEEANAFTERDFDELLARLRGTSGPYRQVILTTNPDAPLHWINQRLMLSKQAKVYFSYARDNPKNAREYIQTLELMTGMERLRLLEGQWVLAEGAIFENWSLDENVSTKVQYNPNLPLLWGVDDGYALGGGPGSSNYHPRVVLFAQESPTGGLDIFDEYYAALELSEVTIKNALKKPYGVPDLVYIDSSAVELKGRLIANGIMCHGATHPVSEGVKAMRRLVCDSQGVRQLRIHPRCINLNREMASYHYDDNSSVASVGERKPAKVDDHGVDSCRYLAWHLRSGN